jgi:hypothetical protein
MLGLATQRWKCRRPQPPNALLSLQSPSFDVEVLGVDTLDHWGSASVQRGASGIARMRAAAATLCFTNAACCCVMWSSSVNLQATGRIAKRERGVERSTLVVVELSDTLEHDLVAIGDLGQGGLPDLLMQSYDTGIVVFCPRGRRAVCR